MDSVLLPDIGLWFSGLGCRGVGFGQFGAEGLRGLGVSMLWVLG